MSSTLTKNIVLSQQRIGQNSEPAVTSLPCTVHQGEDNLILKVEIPGVDPSTVNVSSEGTVVRVECERGTHTHLVDPTTDISKIRAEIQWGMLTLTIPNPPSPVNKEIKVNLLDSTTKG